MPEQKKLSEQEEADRIHLRSEEVQEILSYIPHWIIRWGITVILLAVGLIIAMSYIIQYPDVIPAPVAFTTNKPPNPVVAPISGRVLELTVSDKDQVKKGDLLAVMNNPSKYESVSKLERHLNTLDKLSYDETKYYDNKQEHEYSGFMLFTNMTNIPQPKIKDLGPLQTPYAQLTKHVLDYQNFVQLQAADQRLVAVQNEIAEIEELNQKLRNREPLLKEDIALSQSNVDRYQKLGLDSTMAKTNVEQQERDLVNSKLRLESFYAELQQNELRIAQLQNSLNEHQLSNLERQQNLETLITQALRSLQGQVTDWKNRYLVTAPIEGIISLPDQSTYEQTVQAGQEIMTIVPIGGSEAIVGKLALQGQGAGKVAVGQRVNIKLNDYPHHEFGMLLAEVTEIDLVPRNNSYEAKICLLEDFNTTYHKKVAFRQGMTGLAEVITEDLRLIERIFSQFKPLIQQLKVNKD